MPGNYIPTKMTNASLTTSSKVALPKSPTSSVHLWLRHTTKLAVHLWLRHTTVVPRLSETAGVSAVPASNSSRAVQVYPVFAGIHAMGPTNCSQSKEE